MFNIIPKGNLPSDSNLIFMKPFLYLIDSPILRRNVSLIACYSLKFTGCSLLVVKSLVARCKICSLLVAEVARCKKSLVTRCKIHLLLVAEVARCKKSLVTRCKIRSLLAAEVARCKKSLATCYFFLGLKRFHEVSLFSYYKEDK